MGYDANSGKLHIIVFSRAGMYIGVPIENVLEAYKLSREELVKVPCVNSNIAGLFIRHEKPYYVYDILDVSRCNDAAHEDSFPCIILQGIGFCEKSILADDVFGTLSYIKQEVKNLKQSRLSELLQGYLQRGDRKILLPDMKKVFL